jgi:O-antigen/teichoic acid export membrane protein
MATGAFWSLIGALLSRGLALLSSVIIARFLGADFYGEFGIIQSTIGMFGTFAGLGLGITSTKYIAQYRQLDKDRTGRIIGLIITVASIASIVISLLLFFLAPWLANMTLSSSHLVILLRIGSLYLFLLSFIGLQNGILSGYEAFKSIAIRSIIAGVSTFPLMIGGVYFFGLTGAVWGLVGSSVVNVLLNYFAIRKISIDNGIKIKIKNCLIEKSVLHDFALPAFLATVMVGPVTWICNTILVNKSGGFSEMGLYNVANQWMLVILFVPSTLSTIILPLLTNIISEDNSIKHKQILKYNIILNVVIATILSLFVCLCSGFIVNFYGEKFIKSQPVLITLAFTAILIAYNNVIGQALASKNKMWIGLYLNTLWAFVLIFLTFFFVDKGDGALGFAKANFLAYFLHSIVVTSYYKLNS